MEEAEEDWREAERDLVAAALAGDDAAADAVAARRPDLAERSLVCGLALASPGVSPGDVNAALPPEHWPPLLYLCSSRYRGTEPGLALERLKIADALLAGGADPNAGCPEAESVRGWRTALGAAIGHARSPALAKRLLDAGADVADGPTLYEGCALWHAVRGRDLASIELLLAADPPQWHVCHALPHALGHHDPSLIRLLLERGGDPNWTMGAWGFKGNCLHEAVMWDSAPPIVQALLAAGAKPSFPDRDGRTPLALATCLGRSNAAAALRRHGAKEAEIRPADRWVGACLAGEAHPAPAPASLAPADHLWLCRALRENEDAPPVPGGARAARRLLAGGLDPNAVDDDGERPLHLAAAAGNAEAVAALLAAGGDATAVNFAGRTPVDVAVAAGNQSLAEALAKGGGRAGARRDAGFREAFERAADAVVDGDLAKLRALLRERPALATARSRRPHRCTLLHYLGANGFEHWRQRTPANAVAVIEFLIDAGGDPNAVCYTYRGGPGEHALGLLVSSGHPREAGLTLAMVAALARGGATLDGPYPLLAELHDARRAGRLAAAAEALDPASAAVARAVVECAALGETELLLALLDAGAPVDARRDDGATALHQAAFDGNAALARALLARGADPTLRDDMHDGTPAGWALAAGHDALGGLLSGRANAT